MKMAISLIAGAVLMVVGIWTIAAGSFTVTGIVALLGGLVVMTMAVIDNRPGHKKADPQ